MNRLLSKFPKKYRESVKEAVTSYVNARTQDKYDPRDHIQNIEQKIAEVDRQAKQVSEEKNRERAKRSYENKKEAQRTILKPVEGSSQDLLDIMSKAQDEESKTQPKEKPAKEISTATKAKKTRTTRSEAKSKGTKEELKAVHSAGKSLAKEIRGKHLAKNDPIHYFLHHEELEKKYRERAAVLSKDKYKGMYVQRGNVKEHLVPDIINWVNDGPVKVAKAVNFPGDKALQNLVKSGKYTQEEVSKAKTEYEKYKKQANKEKAEAQAQAEANKKNEQEQNAISYQNKKNDKLITYSKDLAYKYEDNQVKSSEADMDIKIPGGKIDSFGGEKVSLKEADKEDIADYLFTNYNINTEPDNIKVTKEDEVHITNGYKAFTALSTGEKDKYVIRLPKDVFDHLKFIFCCI